MNLISIAEFVLILVLIPAVGAVITFLARYLLPDDYDKYVAGFVVVYLVYFGGSYVYSVFVSELRETPVLGIFLGESPVFAMILTAFGVGMAFGVGAHRVYEARSEDEG